MTGVAASFSYESGTHEWVRGEGASGGRRDPIPIIFMTAHEATRERARRAGVAAYLRTPFAKRAPMDAIRRTIGPERVE